MPSARVVVRPMVIATLTALVASAGIGFWRAPAAIAGGYGPHCPSASSLERPANPRGAVPAAKAAFGADGRVLEVTRGPGSTYAAAARRACGVAVLRDSIYVVVHPIGMTCSACNLHAYVVKPEHHPWKVWIAY